MLELGVLVLLAIPIVAWVVVHNKGRASPNEELPTDGVPKHRWWQP